MSKYGHLSLLLSLILVQLYPGNQCGINALTCNKLNIHFGQRTILQQKYQFASALSKASLRNWPF